MARIYSQEAIEKARELYCRYGGRSHNLIERDMRKAGWAGWQRGILYDKGYNENARLGWVTRHGFDNSLRIYTEKLVEHVNDDEQDLYLGIKKMRQHFQKLVSGAKATKDEVYQYRDFCKLEIEARRNLDLTRDNLETFVSGYEKLLAWAGEIDASLVKLLVKHGNKLAELAQAHYGGKEKEVNDGAGSRANEGRERTGGVEGQQRR